MGPSRAAGGARHASCVRAPRAMRTWQQGRAAGGGALVKLVRSPLPTRATVRVAPPSSALPAAQ